MFKKVLAGTFVLVVVTLAIMNFYIPPVSENHGRIQTELFLGEGENQPLIVGFGGGEGGNAWASDRWKTTRDEFIKQGYSFLAVGYFGSPGTPAQLDRISLNAIHDSIIKLADHPQINTDKIALIGGSKGAELVLNLASRYKEFDAVVGIVPSHVSFPATTIQALTSSWIYNNEEVTYVPMPWAAVPAAMKQDLHGAFSIMLEDNEAVNKAEIAVENINGPILIVSATKDEMWPSTIMGNKVIQRLEKKQFKYYYKHIPIEGGHSAPLNHFDVIFDFLDQHFKN